MSEEKDFLAHFISDEIYVIGEQTTSTEETSPAAPISESEPLIDTASQASPPTPTMVEEPVAVTLKPIHTHGENLKHCIVMFSAEGKISPESKDLLFKILAAIDRKPKDVLMANVHGCSTESVEALINENNHKHLISFGVKQPAFLKVATVYQPILEKGKHYLLSDNLEEVAIDNTKKRALWVALQSIFK